MVPGLIRIGLREGKGKAKKEKVRWPPPGVPELPRRKEINDFITKRTPGR